MIAKTNVFDSYKGISAMSSEQLWPPYPPYPPPCPPKCLPGPRGPAGPPGPQGLRGLPGSLNNTAISFAYAQLSNLIKQLIEYYPTNTLSVYIIGFSPSLVSGLPYELYSSTEGTFGSLFILDDGGNHQAVPLSAICAIYIDGVAYNPAITYIPKPDFPPGYDTNEITAIHDYVGGMTTDVQFYMDSHVNSSGAIYLNPYGLIVQANTDGTNPLFIPVMHIIAFEPYTTTTTGSKSDSTQVKITT
ncbi:MAG: hypothetical protein LKJ25_11640 [Clostridia bacterium]|jgi:hypothetical protein|nr:hypothetical protein [Clostridia bacterium]